jgi:hypothetical protein
VVNVDGEDVQLELVESKGSRPRPRHDDW